ncbi:16S rRNA (uracil(1498)-N(3))-methyltransferase [Epidermidibacterium keratini]|uniref:Ribosomal RNA small subunit methyltransferase E n=1 Tax=Epidermidibacterium keratini TaxID=1891644 RepID=A0A7L4YSU1_9ACTN|nr:16S rRNA (uracil(1498)-N(3))-methyltransferase [Epidermidibacterium keratini]
MPVFYRSPLPSSDSFELDGDEGHHAARVRRVRVGERLRIADGAGTFADCVVTSVGPRSLVVDVESRGSAQRRTPSLTVAQALPKADRGTLAVELLTEAGVDEIVPWQAEHSVARWDGKEAKGVAKWAAVAREAAKQSRRVWIPSVTEPVRGRSVASLADGGRRLIVLHESAAHPIDAVSLDVDGPDVVLVVGPEGGIAPGELDALVEAGADVVRLGPEVLRTSSAGIVAATWASIALGRWS